MAKNKEPGKAKASTLKARTAESRPLKPKPEGPPVEVEEPLSPTGQWIGWSVWGGFVLIGFCFGVWVGTSRTGTTAPVETAQASPEPQQQPPAPPPVTPPKLPTVTPPEPKKVEPPKPPEPTPPEPTPKPPEPTPDPPKPPEPTPPPPPPSDVAMVSLKSDIMPLFRTKCLNCHGGAANVKGGLDMKTLDSMTKGGKMDGPGLTAGDLKKSSIWFRVEDDSMPEDKPLNAAEKKLIKDWILGGLKP